jgi:hypothetical protein
MRKGGGPEKGHEWERETGRLLSLWLTNSERPDIFSRNVLSGGAFTLAEKAGKKSSRAPGDIIAAHPLAFRFLAAYSIECKHLRDIGLMRYLLDPRGLTPLGQIISLARRQARHIDVEYMVIAKQNHKDAMVFVSGLTGDRMLASLRRRGRREPLHPLHHWFHGRTVFAMRFRDMLSMIDPDLLLPRSNPYDRSLKD